MVTDRTLAVLLDRDRTAAQRAEHLKLPPLELLFAKRPKTATVEAVPPVRLARPSSRGRYQPAAEAVERANRSAGHRDTRTAGKPPKRQNTMAGGSSSLTRKG